MFSHSLQCISASPHSTQRDVTFIKNLMHSLALTCNWSIACTFIVQLKNHVFQKEQQGGMIVIQLCFFPAGRAWGAVTTEGLLIFTLDSGIVFNPFDLSIEITPQAIRKAVHKGELASALVMSLSLNEQPLIVNVLEAIPLQDGTGVIKE